jgi:hypothetical protein
MVDPGRNHQNIPRVHVVRPVRDAVFRAEQHADDELGVGRRPLRPQSNRERSDAEGEVSDADMGQQATEPAPLKLHHIDMRAVNGVAKTFETIDARRDDRQAVHRQSPLIRCPNHSRMRLNRGAALYRPGISLFFSCLRQPAVTWASVARDIDTVKKPRFPPGD